MIKFISFLVRPQDIKRITDNLSGTDSPKGSAYFYVNNLTFYWQHTCQVGNATNGSELVIKSLDDLDKVLLLISLGLDTKELQEIIDGDYLDTL